MNANMRSTQTQSLVRRRILGIDPGLRATGFGIIDQLGQQLHYVASGVIRSQQESSLPARLKVIFEGVAEIAAHYRPLQGEYHSAVEKVFVNVNPQSTLLLGQARGAVICALIHHQLIVHEYTALQLKQATVGYGRATKMQMQAMVQRTLNLSDVPSPDAADALACAITHAHSDALLSTLGNLAPELRRRGLRIKRGRLIG